MAKPNSTAHMPPSPPKFGMRDLPRMALWGVSASAALTLVAYAGTTTTGHSRMHLAIAEVHEILIPSGTQPIRPLDAREGRRLAETVRTLAADRERLVGRVATLEQSIDDITGSIARVEKAAKAAPPEAVSVPSPRQEDVTSSITAPAASRYHRRRRFPTSPNSGSILVAPARSRRCEPPGPLRSAATASSWRGWGRWCRRASEAAQVQ